MTPEIQARLDAENAAFAAAGNAGEEESFLTTAEKSIASAIPGSNGVHGEPNATAMWMAKLPRNISIGVLNAAIAAGGFIEDTLSAGGKVADAAGKGAAPAENLAAAHIPRVSDFIKEPVLAFRNYLAKGSGISDDITQSVAQFVVPYTGWSKAVAGVGGASKLANAGRVLAAESAAVATAFQPHEGRFADLLALGKHTENRFADTLNTIAPDGSLFNDYINYMTDRTNEGEWEGRVKNIADNAMLNVAVASVIKSAGISLKLGRTVLENAGNGPPRGSPAGQRGSVGVQNNASGESSASLEAISRNKQEAAAGQVRAVIDTDGTVRPLTGVDAVDAVARPGQMIVQKGVGASEWTPLDRGGTPTSQLTGRISAAKSELDKLVKGN